MEGTGEKQGHGAGDEQHYRASIEQYGSGLRRSDAGKDQQEQVPGVQLMEPVPPEKQLRVTFNAISIFAPTLGLGGKGGSRGLFAGLASRRSGDVPAKKPAFRQVLFDITGSCQPGEVLALLGPSGGGKTSLLSHIGGRTQRAMRKQGEVLFDGQQLTKAAKRHVGFVMQDDLLYASLTVWETLYYAALLRLPRTMTAQQKRERVAKVITALGLDKCKDTIIGDFFRRGISGGERKRVSVGHELLINPSVLLLDEPTSGLDSTTAMHLVHSLRQLASGGRVVITTIHQPSSRLYQLLDKLLLLSEGHAMYYGRADKAADWFYQLGYSMPFGINTADFILDLASADVSTKKLSGDECRRHLIACSEKFLAANPDGMQGGDDLHEAQFGSQLWTAAVSRKDLGSAREPLPEDQHQLSEASSSGVDPDDIEAALPKTAPATFGSNGDKGSYRWGATYNQQVHILFARAVKTRRFETLSKQDFCQYITIGVLAGLFWLQKGQTANIVNAKNTIGILFFELLFTSLRQMLGSIFTFPAEYKMMLKERASGMYRLSAFYLARTASDLPMTCAVPSIFVIIIYFMAGLRLSAAAFFRELGRVTLSMMLVGGFYVNDIPAWIGWLKYLSFIYFGYVATLKIEFGGRTFYDCGGLNLSNPESRPSQCHPVDLQAALKLPANPNTWHWDVLALIGWLILVRVLVYVALRRKTARL
ncbi:hypothetical protein WJX72_005401 [[Myrmecia] bisecta]|uniref:ABC transporter domain-containing protein n=1 Tax=[Myrmecia] bisecta TaxID=41462 RepID=A0AAW1Q5C1_9CHLO